MALDQVRSCSALLELFRGRSHWLVLYGWRAEKLGAVLAGLQPSESRRIWLELNDHRQLGETELAPEYAGWIARGTECGGWVGRESAFVLTQWLARQNRPFLIQGGIGPHTAAACRAAGASGVVLEEQLWLMPESPLQEDWRELLGQLGGQDCPRIGDPLGTSCRVAARPNLPAGFELAERAQRIATATDDPADAGALWRRAAEDRLGWGPPRHRAWPVGQAVGLAAPLAREFKTTGRLVRALIDGTAAQIESARRQAPLAPESPLARSHGTRYPLVQGPMTRVSDRAEFAAEVAFAGALPLLAVALLDGDQTRELVEATRLLLGDRPWGAGLLGFIDPERRRQQIEVIRHARPPFALIAGGRPDQAAALEAEGIATYLHVPLPGLLRAFLTQGARRFIFEGSECGGHVGPLTSFALWESMMETLLEELTAESPETSAIHVLFAGGVHDACSAAMVASLVAPLAARGAKVGVLMGTAYLFTREAVNSGAIVPDFQQRALDCQQTVELNTGPGHAIRCAPTPFAEEFRQERHRLIQSDRPVAEITAELERLTVGRARIASKGLGRESTGRLAIIEAPQRLAQGMYMMGDLAALRAEITDLNTLHEEVSVGSSAWLEHKGEERPASPRPASRPARVAIVGVSCLLPGASDPATFWRNMLNKFDAITEIPPRRWDWRRYYAPDPKEADKIYSRWGGFLDEIAFDPVAYGIPPRSLRSIATSQLLAMEAARRALEDAGCLDGGFDRSNTAVIIGISSMADLEHFYITRCTLGVCREQSEPATLERLPEWSEESFPGILTNVVAGRIANRFDLGGPNFVVDAACASSLAAVDLGVRELREGRSDLVLVGGVELDQTPHAYLSFSKTRALSPLGRARVFDRRADGIVISEGVVMMVLKRLEDAERDGDRVYAIVQATAGSDDGRGQGLTAPKSAGQRRALDRAYTASGMGPETLGLYEAHGTGTALGDYTELNTVDGWLREADTPPRTIAIGSAKSLLGHTKAAAGLVGLLKAAMALYHNVLPPHAGVDEPLEPLIDPTSPAYLLDQPRPWLTVGPAPRRAGVSAFGFGGTNFHAVLQEYTGAIKPAPLGGDDWPCELVVVAAEHDEALRGRLLRLRRFLRASAPYRLADLAYTCAVETGSLQADGRKAAIVADSPGRLIESIEGLLDHLEGRGAGQPPGVCIGSGADAADGATAFLFPGQGVAAPGICREPALYLPELRAAIEQAESFMSVEHAASLGQLAWPPAAFTVEERQRQSHNVTRTRVAQPLIGALSQGWLDLARRLGLRPALLAGHSFGELTALYASGALDRAAFLALAVARGRIMGSIADGGGMAAVSLSRDELASRLGARAGLVIANHNAPRQCVISGAEKPLESFLAELKGEGVTAARLQVSAAFHSPHMSEARAAWSAVLDTCDIRPMEVRVYGGDGQPYPNDTEAIRRHLILQLEAPVDFVGQVRALHEAGIRLFIEPGPGAVLTGLVRQILVHEPHTAIALDATGFRGFLDALASLVARGCAFDLPALFRGRRLQKIDLDRAEAPRPAEWFVDGGRVRHRDETTGLVGSRPLVTFEDAAHAAELAASDEWTPPLGRPINANGQIDDALVAYREYQETMRQFLSSQEQVVSKFLDRLGAVTDTTAVLFEPSGFAQASPLHSGAQDPPQRELPGPEQPTVARAQLPWSDRSSATRFLQTLVSKQTGYPVEVLGIHQDLESELGIDSLKRIEILSEFGKHLPAEVWDRFRTNMDGLTRVRSLGAVIDAVLREVDLTAAPSARSVPLPAVASPSPTGPIGPGPGLTLRAGRVAPDDNATDCPRFVMKAHEKPLPAPTVPPPEGLILVTEDGMGVARLLVANLHAKGLAPYLIPRTSLLDSEAIGQHVAQARGAHGPVRSLVHLAPLVPPGDRADLQDWRQEVQVQVKSLFHLLRLVASELGAGGAAPGAVLAATRFGGLWGRDDVVRAPGAGGGIHGLLRTLEAESARVLAKTVDFDDRLAAPAIAGHLLRELWSIGDEIEVGYLHGRRTVFSAARAPLELGGPPRDWEPQPGWVVLATGGARGITSELVRGLARPGVRLVIVGRSADVGAGDNEVTAHPDADAAKLRQILTAAALAQGKSPEATPARIEVRVQDALRRRRRAASLEEYRRRGAEIEYHALDVRDAAAFGRLIDGLYKRHGRIDGVIHGAGIVEDRLLLDKSPESFERVFDTKVDPAFVLGRRLRPDGLAWIVLLSSVAGRFGNRGQVDYAAANETLNRLAWSMAADWLSTRVVSINYGPWRSDGMADSAVLQQLAQQGIHPIEPATGRRFFADELAYGTARDVEVIAGHGPWAVDDSPMLSSLLEVGLVLLNIQTIVSEAGRLGE
jgi:acyl transferase domain-containing protein/NAD(P)-dependent dehydrogenase (short-subunit alcohol dehydrogenase family)/NAD(P)H-dependent flavin oxidoreductase YrpB (nitropropane dioxygenase family)